MVNIEWVPNQADADAARVVRELFEDKARAVAVVTIHGHAAMMSFRAELQNAHEKAMHGAALAGTARSWVVSESHCLGGSWVFLMMRATLRANQQPAPVRG